MSINIKAEFIEYLKSKIEEDNSILANRGINIDNVDDVSIFMFAEEFKTFLQDEYNCGQDTFSINITDRTHLKLKNNKLVNQQEEQDNKGTEKGNISYTDVLNAFFEDEAFLKEFDYNKDGTFSNAELSKFFNTTRMNDGDGSNISFNDIISAANNIGKNKFQSNPNIYSENKYSNISELTDTFLGNGAAVAGGSSALSTTGGLLSGGNSVGNAAGGLSSDNFSDIQEKNLDNMSKEELQSELNSAQSDLSTKQNALSEAISGSSPELQALQDNIDKAYETYQEELKKVDEDMAKQIDNLKQNIDSKESEINENDQAIASQEATVSDCENEYNNAVSARESLEATLSTLKSALSSAKDEDKAAIEAQIAQVEDQIAQAKKDEEKAKTAWDNAQKELDKLNEKKETLQKELDDLNTEMSELEVEITEKYPEIQQYLDAYNQAKTDYNTAKTEAVNNAQSAVSESENYVNEIKTAISQADDKSTMNENLSVISPLLKYNEELGKKLLDKALELYGGNEPYGGWCAAGVINALEQALGIIINGDAWQLADALKGVKGMEEITDYYNGEDLAKTLEDGGLPPGAIVVFSKYDYNLDGYIGNDDGQWGHVYIADGNGGEVSDYYLQDNDSQFYLGRGASFRIFIPT